MSLFEAKMIHETIVPFNIQIQRIIDGIADKLSPSQLEATAEKNGTGFYFKLDMKPQEAVKAVAGDLVRVVGDLESDSFIRNGEDETDIVSQRSDWRLFTITHDDEHQMVHVKPHIRYIGTDIAKEVLTAYAQKF